MKRFLVMTAGSQVGRAWSLDGQSLSIGRHTDNDIQLKDLAVSRFHCEIKWENGSWYLVDRNSQSGTYLNREKVENKNLQLGDRLQVGQTLFEWCGKLPPDQKDPLRRTVHDASTIVLHRDAVFDLLLGNEESNQTEGVRAQLMSMLLTLSEALFQAKDLTAMGRILLSYAMEQLPADRAALVFCQTTEDIPTELFLHGTGCEKPFAIGDVLTQTTDSKWGMLWQKPQASGAHEKHPLDIGDAQAFICVPIYGPYHYLGALYLEQIDRMSFGAEHLSLATGLARIAASPLEKAYQKQILQAENKTVRGESFEHGMIGESEAMKKVYQVIQKVATTDSTILVRGESGTGKELASRAIFRQSSRRDKPFVAINCAVLSENLLNSELFGHERGAFTGAVSRKLGKLELAQGGTLFLDEVGELPPSIQAKLLRVLQEREFERLGGNRTIKVDIRIIAATNRPLEKAIQDGTFREDLFYRLNVIAFTMPPLRERGRDILRLANGFAAKFSADLNKPFHGISSWAQTCLVAYAWPGNVRELSNAMERAVVLGEDTLIRVEDLPESLRERQPKPTDASPANYQAALNERKKELIRAAMLQADGNVTKAAGILDLHPNYLHRLMRNLQLKICDPKSNQRSESSKENRKKS